MSDISNIEWASVLLVMFLCWLFFLGCPITSISRGEIAPIIISGIIETIVTVGFITAIVYSNRHIRDRPKPHSHLVIIQRPRSKLVTSR
ncbi:MAG: hypothetical protein N2V75_05040 [Methanophagales archaeon]|nr:hypothetical protein [Methanophagales archaeon]